MSRQTDSQLRAVEFGVDGVVSPTGAAEFLGVSRRTVDRLRESGVLAWRYRPNGHSVAICRRSIREYVLSMVNDIEA